ncbi:RimJ/RimL family protein N-acetyltransferase [Rhodoligotrophos appendicifer]|uniref:GNAT family N-acetyltransferase n=1 Tax=Rhodoligotrophos appendicifer TaxID=987056 RepID=UPI001185A68E|nr:GNAT family protein [Rhodoligotrophos appendicifer]
MASTPKKDGVRAKRAEGTRSKAAPASTPKRAAADDIPGPRQPVGLKVDPLPPGKRPDNRLLFGRTVTLEPLDPSRHAMPLFEGFDAKSDPDGEIWTYLPYGPWTDYTSFYHWLSTQAAGTDPKFYAIVPRRSQKAEGVATYLNIRPELGVLEVGHIWFTPQLQKTRAATEAIFLMMKHAFEDLGCRRFEWKCDSLNAPSRAAAKRYGFRFEGIFRKHMIVKGRNRDTAWFSITNDDWPDIRMGFQAWLADENFDDDGKQRKPLGAFVRPGE